MVGVACELAAGVGTMTVGADVEIACELAVNVGTMTVGADGELSAAVGTTTMGDVGELAAAVGAERVGVDNQVPELAKNRVMAVKMRRQTIAKTTESLCLPWFMLESDAGAVGLSSFGSSCTTTPPSRRATLIRCISARASRIPLAVCGGAKTSPPYCAAC
jgi:hypothetical protein